jgi:hypothetical protein
LAILLDEDKLVDSVRAVAPPDERRRERVLEEIRGDALVGIREALERCDGSV